MNNSHPFPFGLLSSSIGPYPHGVHQEGTLLASRTGKAFLSYDDTYQE
jgi:hypothetical protein